MTRALFVILLLASTASAQSPKQDEAKAHFTLGKASQDRGDYAKAAEEFKLAYTIDPRPEMLFNIAQAYRLAHDAKQALDFFQQYLSAQPDGAGAAEARQHVDELTKELEAEAPPPPPPTPVITPLPQPETPPAAATSSRGTRIAGLVALGAGAVGIGLGVKLGLDARSASDAITSQKTAWQNTDQSTYENGQTANRNMYISYAVGGALVVTGAVLYWIGSRTHVAPVVTAQSASLALWGRF